MGDRIRERREELDLSLREFAKLLRCSPPFVSDIEHGRRFPSDTTLAEIARLLTLDVDELRQLDPRPPLDEIKRMAAGNPAYGFAFRTLVDKKITAEELLRFASKRHRARKPQKK